MLLTLCHEYEEGWCNQKAVNNSIPVKDDSGFYIIKYIETKKCTIIVIGT